ncbi:MAG: PaaI family thioesterase [Actinomycetota bacterium]|nr:PaaI family thioesterase [Actinomycetota bacterium]
MATDSSVDPLELAAHGRELSGIEYVRRIFAGELPPPPIAELMGFSGVDVGPGRALFEMTPGHEHYNPIGTVHGGVAMTLLDSAMGCAVHTTLEAGVAYTTLEVKVNLVRPITAETGLIRCEGTVVHSGSRVATAEGRLVDGSGKLLAHGTTTCLIMRQAP